MASYKFKLSEASVCYRDSCCPWGTPPHSHPLGHGACEGPSGVESNCNGNATILRDLCEDTMFPNQAQKLATLHVLQDEEPRIRFFNQLDGLLKGHQASRVGGQGIFLPTKSVVQGRALANESSSQEHGGSGPNFAAGAMQVTKP